MEHILPEGEEEFRNELTVIGFPESTGERVDNSIQLIGCLSEMTHVNIGVQSESFEGKLEIYDHGTWKWFAGKVY